MEISEEQRKAILEGITKISAGVGAIRNALKFDTGSSVLKLPGPAERVESKMPDYKNDAWPEAIPDKFIVDPADKSVVELRALQTVEYQSVANRTNVRSNRSTGCSQK